MKKKVVLSGSLKDMVTYCTAIYEISGVVAPEVIENIIKQSPIFENKNFYTNVLGTVQKTTVTRNSKVFINNNVISLQIRYEILRMVDIELTEKDEQWIKNDVESLLKHFEVLLESFEETPEESEKTE
ncbi:MAG: hypothetical protein R6W68_14370 [Ignavibacteriaceae bacterium]